MRRAWRGSIIGRLLGLHSPTAHLVGQCWCRLAARRKAAREALAGGWIDSPCDGCEGALAAPSYVIQVKPGHPLLTCPSCAWEFRSAGATLLRVLA